jgi:hypothetical protein
VNESIVPPGFEVPEQFEGSGYRLEPLGPVHNSRDHVAWMASIDHIRSTTGFPMDDGWPYPMSLEDNLTDLEQHLDEFHRRAAFAFSVLDSGADVIGCVYITPDRSTPNGVRLRSWVVASLAELDETLRDEVAAWLARDWPFSTVDTDWE